MLSFSGLNIAFWYFDGVFSLVQSGRAAACACSGLISYPVMSSVFGENRNV